MRQNLGPQQFFQLGPQEIMEIVDKFPVVFLLDDQKLQNILFVLEMITHVIRCAHKYSAHTIPAILGLGKGINNF